MDIARDDDLGDHRLHMALDEPAQRTGAIDGIIAILDNIGARRVSQLNAL